MLVQQPGEGEVPPPGDNGAMPASLLVVEDDDTIRETIREALGLEGFVVTACGNSPPAAAVITAAHTIYASRRELPLCAIATLPLQEFLFLAFSNALLHLPLVFEKMLLNLMILCNTAGPKCPLQREASRGDMHVIHVPQGNYKKRQYRLLTVHKPQNIK